MKKIFRTDRAAERRVGLARERLLAMSPDQRAAMTTDRLAQSFGLTANESAQLLQAFGGR